MSLTRAALVVVQAFANGVVCTPPNPTPKKQRYHTEQMYILQIAPAVFKVCMRHQLLRLSLYNFSIVAPNNRISLRGIRSSLLSSQYSSVFSPQPVFTPLRSHLPHKSGLDAQHFVDTLSNPYFLFGRPCRLARSLHTAGLLQNPRPALHLRPHCAPKPPAYHQAILRICAAPSLYRIPAPRCWTCSFPSYKGKLDDRVWPSRLDERNSADEGWSPFGRRDAQDSRLGFLVVVDVLRWHQPSGCRG